MGLFRKIADIAYSADTKFSSSPEAKGQRFENHVKSLFSERYFAVAYQTPSFRDNKDRYVESSLHPDFIFRYKPTGEQFGVECKYRSSLNNRDMLEWSNPEQIKRYQKFSKEKQIPVFVVIALEGFIEENGYEEPETFMFNIPLEVAKYPTLYPSVFEKYQRPYDKNFFWKNGKLS